MHFEMTRANDIKIMPGKVEAMYSVIFGMYAGAPKSFNYKHNNLILRIRTEEFQTVLFWDTAIEGRIYVSKQYITGH